MTRPELTQEMLRSLLEYDPETGIFHWRIRHNNRIRADRVAGTLTDGYINIRIGGLTYGAHRLAWLYVTGELPSVQIDHRNTDRGDNSWTNLRKASPSQNAANAKPRTDGSSGVKGVSWERRRNKWVARIRVNLRRIHLGQFERIEDAQAAYAAAAAKAFGEFARVS